MEERLRAGRLSYEEREMLLVELGKIAKKKYNKYLKNGNNYNLDLLEDALQFAPDVLKFDNAYWVDAGDEKLNKIANYFEYGTGLFNTKHKKSVRTNITSISGALMPFFGTNAGKMIFAKEVKGVKPVFMFTKTMKSMALERMHLQRKIRFSLGI